MLKDEVVKVIESELKYGDQRGLYHYNCAETLLGACNERYNLELDNKTLKAIVPFGAGFYSEKACGLLTAGIASLGIMYAQEKPTLNEKVQQMTKQWVKAFEEEFGDTNCAQVKAVHKDEVKKCELVMARAAELFEEVVCQGELVD